MKRHRSVRTHLAGALAAGLAASALVGATAGPATAAGTPTPSATTTPSPSASASPSPSPSASPEAEHALSAAELKAQITEADRLWTSILASSSELSAAMQEMASLSTKINGLLESLDKAKQASQLATAAAVKAREELAATRLRLDKARQALSTWAFDAYTGGGQNADVAGMLDAMEVDASEVSDPLGDVSYLTDQRSRTVASFRALSELHDRLAITAAETESAALEAQRAIERDKAALDKALVGQKAKLDRIRKLQLEEIAKASPVSAALLKAATPEAAAAAERLRQALEAASVDLAADIGPPCTKDDGTIYPNGMMPAAALCPLWGAPGQSLKPKAAAAFNAMSKAYASQTGHPICVSDSYRSLARQYTVKASRGKWAATPGTSPHGRGVAVDLGCGVQDFGHPAHLWLKQNAHIYGWYHPAWAAPGGPLPEPWHWQYAGD